jgi:hypothetical protein
MEGNSTTGRSLAIVAGIVLLSGTLAILFEDVVRGAPFALKHYLTLVVVAGTMMAGHWADQSRRARHFISCTGFALIFVAGTGLVVYSSVGRQAEKTMLSSAEHDDVMRQRLDLEGSLARDRQSIKEKRELADKECASGEGRRCLGVRSSVEFYENSAKGTEARLALMAPAKPVAPEAEQLGIIAEALGYDKERVRAIAVLLAPFLTTLFLEFGTIVSFGFAFSPKRKVVREVTKNLGTEQTSFAADGSEGRWFAPDPPNGSPNRGGGRYTKDEAAADLVTRLALGERFASQDELKERYGVAKSTMSDWLNEWERSGLVPARTQSGRCKSLAKA